MTAFVRTAVLSAAFLTIAGSVSAASASAETCAPKKLVHITTVDVSPGIGPTSFAAQPKELYRIGSDKLRIEEALDAPNQLQGVVVISEPNIWMANVYDRTGKHIVDPGPTFFAKAPVFGVEGLAPKLTGLEFGCEADFIAANAPKPVRSEVIGNEKLDVYRIVDGSDAVEILEQPGTGTPRFARYYHQGNLAIAIRYDRYAAGLATDPALFVPVSNVQYAEQPANE